MTLQEISTYVASGLGLTVESVDGQAQGVLAGDDVRVEVFPFFGGWQLDLMVPGRKWQFFAEDERFLIQRVKQRLAAYRAEGHSTEAAGSR